MSTLSPAQEERVGRAIDWALKPVVSIGLTRTRLPTSGSGHAPPPRGYDQPPCYSVETDPAGNAHRDRTESRCLFCGAPGSRLCCDCDDLPALDYGT